MRIRLLVGVVLLAYTGAFAQMPMRRHHGPDSGPDWRQLPPPPPKPGIGEASLKITTNSPQAQVFFNQGLRLLRCFKSLQGEDDEVRQLFHKAITHAVIP